MVAADCDARPRCRRRGRHRVRPGSRHAHRLRRRSPAHRRDEDLRRRLVGRPHGGDADAYADGEGGRGYFQTSPADLRETIGRAHDRAGRWPRMPSATAPSARFSTSTKRCLPRIPGPTTGTASNTAGSPVPSDVERIARLGVIPVPQGRFVHELGDGMLAAIGAERAAWCYRQKSFLDAGSSCRRARTGRW